MRIKHMDDPTTRRRRRRQHDQYADDVLRDGEFLRVPMMLADSGQSLRDVVHQKYPPRGYRRGYVHDQISDPTTQGGWPTQVSGIVKMYNNSVGDPCRCRSGEAGTLQPHPTIQSALICVENRKDGLAANDRAYYEMCDQAMNAWRVKVGPVHDQHPCGCHQRDATVINRGQSAAEGDGTGRLVRRNGELRCMHRDPQHLARTDNRLGHFDIGM
jgi:hypothetical protein